MAELLPEDVEKNFGAKNITGSISRHSSTFLEVFIFLVKPPFKQRISDLYNLVWKQICVASFMFFGFFCLEIIIQSFMLS